MIQESEQFLLNVWIPSSIVYYTLCVVMSKDGILVIWSLATINQHERLSFACIYDIYLIWYVSRITFVRYYHKILESQTFEARNPNGLNMRLNISYGYLDIGYGYLNIGYGYLNIGYGYLNISYGYLNIGYSYLNISYGYLNIGYGYLNIGYGYLNIGYGYLCLSEENIINII